MEVPVHSRAATMLLEIFGPGRPLVYVRSAEEGRVTDLLRNAGRQLRASKPLPVWTWSLTEGLSSDEREAQTAGRHLGNAGEARAQDPREVLDFIATHSEPAIFHLKDFHEPLRDSASVRRRLRDLYQICLDRQKFIVITSPLREIPEEIERSLAIIDLLPPDLIELVEFLRSEADQIIARGAHADTSEEILYQLARTLQGLTLDEARHAVRRALATGQSLGAESVPALLEEKRIVTKRSGVIEYVANSTNLEEIGGLETLKKWLLERRKLFQQRDTLSADIVPKGVLVMGIPGCGKSLSVKAIASCFDLPLYRIDMVDDLLRQAWQARRRVRRGVPYAGEHGARDRLVRRDRDGHHVGGCWRSARPYFRIFPDLDAGKRGRAVRRRHREPHRLAACRDDSQGSFRRGFLRGPAAR